MEFFRRLKLRIIWSWEGCVSTWRTEPSFRSWVWANLVSAILAFALPLSPVERALILALGILVLAAELLNTALEDAIDYISTDQHPLAKRAKDAGSAGVAVTSIAAGVAWVIILIG
ncbi:diacylglycerol kinase [Marivita hallyeonensis]|uniref:Diacylglycerol kinase n=1 Tax=Marivita hallyeonensis TaxID=996342 RepID=A0A1M5XG57_9RHOB|nr:diacylglycerol kinase [Marivita hallyeonensis]SHH98810.1 diacylglycerol kinase (ATP) [Marivita hallyeonensis]